MKFFIKLLLEAQNNREDGILFNPKIRFKKRRRKQFLKKASVEEYITSTIDIIDEFVKREMAILNKTFTVKDTTKINPKNRGVIVPKHKKTTVKVYNKADISKLIEKSDVWKMYQRNRHVISILKYCSEIYVPTDELLADMTTITEKIQKVIDRYVFISKDSDTGYDELLSSILDINRMVTDYDSVVEALFK